MGIYGQREVVNEVYFGETPGIKKIQDQLSKFRKKHQDPNSVDIEINEDEDLAKFNRLVEEEFGFEIFNLYIDKQKIMNAFTMPIGFKLDSGNMSKNLIADKNGFKYKKEAGYATIVCVYAGVMCNPTFTDREVMAIILHEIGHNFGGGVNPGIGVMHYLFRIIIALAALFLIIVSMNPFIKALGVFFAFSQTNSYIKFCADINRRIKINFPKFYYAMNFLDSIGSYIKNKQSEISFINKVMMTPNVIGAYGAVIINVIFDKLKSYATNPILLLRSLFGYSDEQFSDTFAAMYGYGADLNSGLSKMTFSGHGSDLNEIFNRIPVIAQLFNLIWLPIELAITLFDEHPTAPARIKTELAHLEAELKKSKLDPKMRARIQNDIKEINKVYEKFYENIDKEDDPFLYKKLYYSWLYQKTGGDVRHLFNKIHSPEATDKGYENALKNVKLK